MVMNQNFLYVSSALDNVKFVSHKQISFLNNLKVASSSLRNLVYFKDLFPEDKDVVWGVCIFKNVKIIPRNTNPPIIYFQKKP